MTVDIAPSYEKPTQAAIRQGRLISRVCEFNSLTPSSVVRPTAATVEAVFAEARAIAEEALAISSELGWPQPGAQDFSEAFPTYARFCEIEAEIERALQNSNDGYMTEIGRDSFLVTTPYFGNILAQGGPTIAADVNKDGIKKWLGKFFGALGLGEIATSVFAMLETDGAGTLALTTLGKAIAAGEWAIVKKYIGILLELIFSKAFLKKLAERIGETVLAKFIGKALAKCLPMVGWVLLIGQFVWAIAAQFV